MILTFIRGCNIIVKLIYAPVAQLDRVSDYGSEGCGFDLCQARHVKAVNVGSLFYTKNRGGNEP